MSERTDPRDALERISWYLAFNEGREPSVNEIAEATGLSWATAQRYTIVLERVLRVCPSYTVDGSDIEVAESTIISELLETMEEEAVTVYLLNYAEVEGGPTEVVPRDKHEPFFEKYAAALDTAEELDWIERTEEGVRLTPTGVRVAGPLRSEIQNGIR